METDQIIWEIYFSSLLTQTVNFPTLPAHSVVPNIWSLPDEGVINNCLLWSLLQGSQYYMLCFAPFMQLCFNEEKKKYLQTKNKVPCGFLFAYFRYLQYRAGHLNLCLQPEEGGKKAFFGTIQSTYFWCLL